MLRVSDDKIQFKGVVTDHEIRSLFLLTLNSQHFYTFKDGNTVVDQTLPLVEVMKININKLNFATYVNLADGNNIILVRPGEKPKPYEEISFKSIVLERKSTKIILNEPKVENNKIVVKGKINGFSSSNRPDLIFSAFVKNRATGKLLLHTFSEVKVDLDPAGFFTYELQLNDSLNENFEKFQM